MGPKITATACAMLANAFFNSSCAPLTGPGRSLPTTPAKVKKVPGKAPPSSIETFQAVDLGDGYRIFTQPRKPDSESAVMIQIPPGGTLAKIARRMAERGILSAADAKFFPAAVMESRKDIYGTPPDPRKTPQGVFKAY